MENAAGDEPELPIESDEIQEDQDDDEMEKEEEKKRADTEYKGKRIVYGDEEMKPADTDEEEDKRKHAELLALPEHGSEVYLCGIPREASAEDIRGFCECIGEVTEGKKIKCETSHTKCRLLIRNLPKHWGQKDTKKAVRNIGPGVVSVEIPMVKTVYVTNLPEDITQDDLKGLFDHHGNITKVVVPRLPPAEAGEENNRHGYVHFEDRSSALKALNEKYEIGGQVLRCVLAISQSEQRSYGASNHQNAFSLPTYPQQMAYDMVGGRPFDRMEAGYGGGRPFYRIGAESGGGRPYDRMGAGYGGGRPYDRMGAGYGGGRPFHRMRAGYGGGRPYDRMGAGYGGGRPFYPIGDGYGGVHTFHPMGAGYTGDRPFYPIRAGYGGGHPFLPLGAGYGGGRPFHPMCAADMSYGMVGSGPSGSLGAGCGGGTGFFQARFKL